MADPKQDEGFKVVDRRLFTEEGELRKDAVEQERREEEAAASKAASARTPAKQAGAPGGGAPGTATGVAAAGAATAATAVEHQPSHSFQMLIDFLARNAAAMLGGMSDPRTGQPFVDLEGAREMIDMLDALRESTRGNLAKADEELLLEVAGSLKLTYMEISKAAAEAMAKKAKGKA